MLRMAAIIGLIVTARWWRDAESRRARNMANPTRLASSPKDKPMHPNDLLATVYYALGIDPDMQVLNSLNQPRELVKGKPVVELWG